MSKRNRSFLLSNLSVAVCALLLSACSSTITHAPKPPIKVVQGNAQNQSVQSAQVEMPKPVVAPQPVITAPQPAVVAAPTQVVTAKTEPLLTPPQPTYYATFGDWKNDFIARTIAKGYDGNEVYRLMNGASFSQRVIELDRSQAEFSKMPWEYVNSAVTNGRVAQGRDKLAQNQSVLNSAEQRFGVPKEIVTAIWGMESSFGAGTGSMDLVNSLSTLAFEGRRREFAENQLLSMIGMINRGDASVSQFKGSWAGGMGHTQFIPSTWMAEAVDGDFDGRKNPWNAADALSSTASYLKNAGWIVGLMPYYEVKLPNNFNHHLIGTKQSLTAWREMGVLSAAGEYFGGEHLAELWLPAGIAGPALLLTPNFDVIRVYNNSSSYALGVALLGKRIAGGGALVATWPTHERPLSRTQVQTLQRNLTAQGFDTGGADGVAGTNTRKAFARWQAANGKIPDGFISQNTAQTLLY